MHFRPFRNDDPPALAAIWNAQAPSRDCVPRVTATLLDDLVFSKLYFDRSACIVVEVDRQPVGFVHVSCGPDARRQGLDWSLGIVNFLMVHPERESDELLAGLLNRAENFLRTRGAQQATVATPTLNPFYVGLYGGSSLPGVLRSQATWLRALRHANYVESGSVAVMQRRLDTFRPTMDRQAVQWRRQFRLDVVEDPLPRTWWEGAVWGTAARTQFTLRGSASRPDDPLAIFWNMTPLADSWNASARGLIDLVVADPPAGTAPGSVSGPGLNAFFLGEILKTMKSQAVGIVEAQVTSENPAFSPLLAQLEFREVDRGLVFTKSL